MTSLSDFEALAAEAARREAMPAKLATPVAGVANPGAAVPNVSRGAITYDLTSLDLMFRDLPDFVRAQGSYVIVQLAKPMKRTSGGIIIPDSHLDAKLAMMALGRVISRGNCSEEQRDGVDAEVGEYVLVSKFGGIRNNIKDDQGDDVTIVALRYNEIPIVLTDPLPVLNS